MTDNAPDRDAICEAFIDAVPFDLYPFQEEAVLAWYECTGGMLITAPTGTGKTLIAETAVFEALQTGTRMYYTTPLIALTDQKLTELQDRAEAWGYPRESIGLLTGNRKVNPEAPIKVVVAEILLNHLLSEDECFDDVSAVVMDEFHYFNDRERGVVWELSLVLLPEHVRLLLLSATVGNAVDFVIWLREKHGRTLTYVQTQDRKVPLEYEWVEDKLLTEQLVEMAAGTGDDARVPALVFCFSRDECWEMAERLKGLPLISKETRARIEEVIAERGEDMKKGISAKLRMMLIRGVGVHHAGLLPRYKDLVERLFTERLIPLVVCTETLAAGVNLPARSVVLKSLLKGKPREKRVLPASGAHQMFGRAGRPQFDDRGFVYAIAHEDDVKILRWKEKYEQIPATAKDPTMLRARKALERKRPSRRKTEQYWTEGQFDKLVAALPANLRSSSMIPYRFLVHLLTRSGDLSKVRTFLAKRFNSAEKLVFFEKQLDAMVDNLAIFGYLKRSEQEGEDRVLVDPSIEDLLSFRSVDPLFGAWLAKQLAVASDAEKLLALEGLLELPWRIAKRAETPVDMETGPLEQEVLAPLMVAMGVVVARKEPSADAAEPEPDPRDRSPWEEEEEKPPTFVEMLKIAFEAELPYPEEMRVQTKWVAGGINEGGGDFARFVASRDLSKNEGLVMRHLLRLVLLAAEFADRTGDPAYRAISQAAAEACKTVDPAHTEQFLERAKEAQDALEAARERASDGDAAAPGTGPANPAPEPG